MSPTILIGAALGALVGWIVSAVFSRGPKTPMEALRGEHASGGVGCLGFIAILVAGAVVGGVIGGTLGG